MHALRYGLLAAFFVVVVTGCEHADPLEPDRIQPTLSSIQTNVFDTNCALSGCHRGSRAPLGLDLSAGNARANLVNVESQERSNLFRVEPGDPDDSYLVRKIEGGPDIVGDRMPRGRPPLSNEAIDAIRTWIENGAPDN